MIASLWILLPIGTDARLRKGYKLGKHLGEGHWGDAGPTRKSARSSTCGRTRRSRKSPRGCAARTIACNARLNCCIKGFVGSEAKDTPHRSIKTDLKNFDKVKTDYCRRHNMTIAQLCARLEDDDQLMTELYRLALAAKLTSLHPTGQDNSPVDLGSPSVQRLFNEAVPK